MPRRGSMREILTLNRDGGRFRPLLSCLKRTP